MSNIIGAISGIIKNIKNTISIMSGMINKTEEF